MKYTQYHRKLKQFSRFKMPDKKYNECFLEAYRKFFEDACGAKTNKDKNEMHVKEHQKDLKDAQEMIYLSIKGSNLELCLPRFLVEIHSSPMKKLIDNKRKEIHERKNGNEKMSIEIGKPSDYIYILYLCY